MKNYLTILIIVLIGNFGYCSESIHTTTYNKSNLISFEKEKSLEINGNIINIIRKVTYDVNNIFAPCTTTYYFYSSDGFLLGWDTHYSYSLSCSGHDSVSYTFMDWTIF